jgi:creatinine amidohydrolase
MGEAELATAEKGRQVFEEAVKQLARFVNWWKGRPKDQRRDLHRKRPTMPMPWGQHELPSRARSAGE